MSAIREELVQAALERSLVLINYEIYDDLHKQYEFRQNTILADKSLTEAEKSEAIKTINKSYDRDKIFFNSGTKKVCENCNEECLATLYCESCVRDYLLENCSNWTSENDDIDNLILQCQMETLEPARVIEWIPYNNLQDIKYLTRGGCSEIYTASWIDGCYFEWDSENKRLKRQFESESQMVVLKKLENVENANQNWFDEAKLHLTISNKYAEIVKCYGLTKDPSNGNYMLVMSIMDIDLRSYLQRNHNKLTWKERIQIAYNIINALYFIHEENAIHRDLHSGNILLNKQSEFEINDLGFCGPADKSSKSIYGNLPYIAPEVIAGKGYSFKSDIYSVAMLMWEISSGQPPFSNHKHDFFLARSIINGIRPKVVPGTPLEYKNLMKQCWDANPSKRPDILTIWEKMNSHYQNILSESIQLKINDDSGTNYTSRFTSSVHQFENMPEPKNATEEEQGAFYHDSELYDFCVPDNIDDELSDQNEDNNENLSKVFDELQINSEDDAIND